MGVSRATKINFKNYNQDPGYYSCLQTQTTLVFYLYGIVDEVDGVLQDLCSISPLLLHTTHCPQQTSTGNLCSLGRREQDHLI